MKTATQTVLYSQLALLASLLVCLLIAPEVLFSLNQGGISNYGTMANTFLVFSLGFGTCIALLVKASWLIGAGSYKNLLVILAGGFGLVTLSTYAYKLNPLLENIHITIAFGFVIFQAGLGWYLAKINGFDRLSRIFLAVQMSSFGFGLLTVFEVAQILFTAQLVGAIGFGSLLVHTTRLQES